jgi:hypothetical protein
MLGPTGGTNGGFQRFLSHIWMPRRHPGGTELRDHVKILGILNIVMGGLTALAGLTVLVAMGGIAAVLGIISQDGSGGDLEGARVAAPILGLIGSLIGIFLLAISLPSIVGGWGLLKYKSWSRVLMIIVSGIHLLHVPLGTALGIYGLWVLLNEQTRQLLESGGAMPPATYSMPQPAGFPGAQPPQGV